MLKIGDKVSLFHDMGLSGVIVNILTEKAIEYWSTTGTTAVKMLAEVSWDNGTKSIHKFEDVMRLE